jgi:hypothetical protein
MIRNMSKGSDSLRLDLAAWRRIMCWDIDVGVHRDTDVSLAEVELVLAGDDTRRITSPTMR